MLMPPELCPGFLRQKGFLESLLELNTDKYRRKYIFYDTCLVTGVVNLLFCLSPNHVYVLFLIYVHILVLYIGLETRTS